MTSKSLYFLFILTIILGIILGYITTTGIKSQNVRLIDIFLLGPLMIFLGIYGYIKTTHILFFFMIFFGASTISYNYKNFIKHKMSTS